MYKLLKIGSKEYKLEYGIEASSICGFFVFL